MHMRQNIMAEQLRNQCLSDFFQLIMLNTHCGSSSSGRNSSTEPIRTMVSGRRLVDHTKNGNMLGAIYSAGAL